MFAFNLLDIIFAIHVRNGTTFSGKILKFQFTLG
jgi:hypothetical protein